VNSQILPRSIVALPKAELHLHLEGSIRPVVAQALAKRCGVEISIEEILQRYAYKDFTEFIETFKWVTSYLRKPDDFAFLASDVCEQLLLQNVVYVEFTLSVGIMLLRGQDPQRNFEALLAATQPFEARGLRANWIFDAVRQFGPEAALDVVKWAHKCQSPRIVAFGIGGDELSLPTKAFEAVYRRVGESGMHRLIHAGEIGGPGKIREAVEILGAERIGHGIGAIHDESLMNMLKERGVTLEICPVSNLRTGALEIQRGKGVGLSAHPFPELMRHGIPVVLSTDDPAMFHTTLLEEYQHVHAMGVDEEELKRVITQGFQSAFLPWKEKSAYLKQSA
jgi:aminodeoxyfutalosine deaminase